MRVLCSWSSGKDSAFACWKALQQSHEVRWLLNSISKEYDRVSFHGVKSELVQLQAEAIGIPIAQPRVTKDTYEQEFKRTISRWRKIWKKRKIEGAVFGDISLRESREWTERVCKELGITPVYPLWGQKHKVLLEEFVQAGFKAMVTCTQANLLGKEWVGRWIDEKFIQDLQKFKDVDLCGENGEYHTFVTAGPLFRKEISLLASRKVLKGGYWFLDILRYKIA